MTEHRSFLRMKEGSLLRTLAFSRTHGCGEEECAMKTEERDQERMAGTVL